MEDGENGGKRIWNGYIAEKSRFLKMAGRRKTWKSVKNGFRKIPWVEKSLFLGQFFTLATIMILILLKRSLTDQKWRFLIGKKIQKKLIFRGAGNQKRRPPSCLQYMGTTHQNTCKRNVDHQQDSRESHPMMKFSFEIQSKAFIRVRRNKNG